MKKEVDLEKLLAVRLYLKELEGMDLEDITWTLKGVEQVVSTEDITYWNFTGLGNRYFAYEKFRFMDIVKNADECDNSK